MTPDSQAVLAFVERFRLPVFPCKPNTKEPIHTGGFHNATTDQQRLREWARKHPGCNWGLATGQAGLVVLDVDVKSGKHGDETLRQLEAQYGPLPDTWQALTPSRGAHYYFRRPANVEIKSGTDKLGNGLDVKAVGGYVLIPPSEIDRKPYMWEASSEPQDIDIAPLPDWLSKVLVAPAEKPPPNGSTGHDRSIDWISNIAQGITLHDSLRDLAAHFASRGLGFEEMCALLEQLMRASAAPHDARWHQRFAEIPGLADSAIAKFRGPGTASTPDDWPEPLNILSARTAPALSAADSVPPIAGYALLFARAGGFCANATLLAGLVTCAAAIHDGVRLRLPQRSSWFESARLWALPIAGPAAGKTPTARAMQKPLLAIQNEVRKQWEIDCAIEKKADKDFKPPPEPVLVVNDTTIEALSEVLSGNRRGVVCVSEEFESWIGAHDAYRSSSGGSRDRGEWLRLYDGGPHRINRINRGSVFVDNWGCSILSATTPGALKKLAPKLPIDGLLQRFIPVLMGRRPKPDTSILHVEMKRAEEVYASAVRRLYLLEPGTVQLGREARELFEAQCERQRLATEAFETVSEPFAAHMGKHAAMLARVALVYHCVTAEDHRADMQAAPMQAAISLLRKVEHHALAVYFELVSDSTAPAIVIAKEIAKALVAHMPERIQRRDLAPKVRAFRSAAPYQQDAALHYLHDCGWIEPVPSTYEKGHPTSWLVNPKISTKFAAEGEAERERRQAVREIIREQASLVREDRNADIAASRVGEI